MKYNKNTTPAVGDLVRVVDGWTVWDGNEGIVINISTEDLYPFEVSFDSHGDQSIFKENQLEIIHDAAYLKLKKEEDQMDECMSEEGNRREIAHKLLEIMENVLEYELGALEGVRKVDAESTLNELRKACAKL